MILLAHGCQFIGYVHQSSFWPTNQLTDWLTDRCLILWLTYWQIDQATHPNNHTTTKISYKGTSLHTPVNSRCCYHLSFLIPLMSFSNMLTTKPPHNAYHTQRKHWNICTSQKHASGTYRPSSMSSWNLTASQLADNNAHLSTVLLWFLWQ